MALISLTNLIKTYRIGSMEHTVLKNISLSINEGEMLAIVGTSGSGKTTLMNIIGLLDKPDSGQYLLHGNNVANLSDDELAERRNLAIGFVFQQFNLLPRLSALQNVALPLTYRRNLANAQIEDRALRVLDRVGMRHFATHCPTQLSGGQQQRVAIARALAGEPRVILADEPTGALDSATSHEIMALFQKLHQEGRTLILVTHDEAVAALCSRRIVLSDGEIIAESQS
jgi:putative ABC transport system ATP-binding protein